MKRTPLVRTGAAQLTVKEKKRKCKVCGTPFRTFSSFVSWCSPEHGAIIGLKKLEKEKARNAAVDRAQDRQKREAMKTRADWMKEAQSAFNAFIRARDADKLCICCDKPLDMGTYSRGGSYDAGHYRSVGSAPHLRFDERNCHAQRKQCNQFGAGRAVDYRIGLIKRIGLEAVEALESDQSTRKYSIDELKAIKAHYKNKLKELQKERNQGVV